jgi:hypothetical protein
MTQTHQTQHLVTPSIQAKLLTLTDAFAIEKSTARAMQAWLEDRCIFDSQAVTLFCVLHADWLKWAQRNRRFCSTPHRLAKGLLHLGLERCVLGSGTKRAYIGIALKPEGAA